MQLLIFLTKDSTTVAFSGFVGIAGALVMTYLELGPEDVLIDICRLWWTPSVIADSRLHRNMLSSSAANSESE